MHGIPSPIGDNGRVLDLAGVGFGPSNLALAVALREADAGLAVRFLEKRGRFVWHGNMLLDGSRMQISFLKDLVSLRDPTSRYSFLNFGGLCDYWTDVVAVGRRIHEELLRPMEPWLTGGEVGRDYRLPTIPGCTAGLYLQGCCEATHGLSDTLLSILPIRAQEIAMALTGGTGRGRGQQIRELTSAQ